MFIPYHYLTTTDPRNALPKTRGHSSPGIECRPTSSRPVEKLGTIRNAFDTLEDEFWKSVFRDMAIPREAFDDEKRAELAARLHGRFCRVTGLPEPGANGSMVMRTVKEHDKADTVLARVRRMEWRKHILAGILRALKAIRVPTLLID
jgi:hypothetical protein